MPYFDSFIAIIPYIHIKHYVIMHITTRKEMVDKHLRGRDIQDPAVLHAMLEVDRTLFVPEEYREHSYEDGPLPIGRGQTISQPYIVAYMAQALDLKAGDKVLEIGSGCGYNAAVLSRIAGEVYTIEIIEWLTDLASRNVQRTGYSNVHIRQGNGYEGWSEEAPFDAIELTAAPSAMPEMLKRQLKTGGRLLAPVGKEMQRLVLLEKVAEDEFREHRLLPVQFVPMTGAAQKT